MRSPITSGSVAAASLYSLDDTGGVVGRSSSAEATTVGTPDCVPPATSTLPLPISAAMCEWRATAMLGHGDQVPHVGSYACTSEPALRSPATMTLPPATVAVWVSCPNGVAP